MSSFIFCVIYLCFKSNIYFDGNVLGKGIEIFHIDIQTAGWDGHEFVRIFLVAFGKLRNAIIIASSCQPVRLSVLPHGKAGRIFMKNWKDFHEKLSFTGQMFVKFKIRVFFEKC